MSSNKDMFIKTRDRLYQLLRWSEKYLKTDMVYLAKGGFWVTLSQFLVSSSSFLLAIAFAYFVPKEVYGEYKYILSIAGVLGTLTLTGLGTAVSRAVVDGDEGTLNYAFWQNLKWSSIFGLSSLALAIYYFVNNDFPLGWAMLMVGTLFPLLNSSNLYSSFLTAKKDYRRNSIYFDIIGNLLPAICLFLVMIFRPSILMLIATYLISNVAVGLVLYLRIISIYKPNKKIARDSLSYGKHLSLMNILGGLANNIDQILVFHFIGATELAIYNFAIAIPNQIKGPLKGLDNLMFPKFAAREENEIKNGMNNKIWRILIGLIVIIVTYIFCAQIIFQVFFPKYLDSVFYSQIFALSLLGMATWPTSTYLFAHKKIKENYWNNIFSSLFQIVAVFIGLYLGGLLGLIIARVVTRWFSGYSNYYFYKKALEK